MTPRSEGIHISHILATFSIIRAYAVYAVQESFRMRRPFTHACTLNHKDDFTVRRQTESRVTAPNLFIAFIVDDAVRQPTPSLIMAPHLAYKRIVTRIVKAVLVCNQPVSVRGYHSRRTVQEPFWLAVYNNPRSKIERNQLFPLKLVFSRTYIKALLLIS